MRWIALTLIAVTICSCKNEKTGQDMAPEPSPAQMELPEDFTSFYHQFHADTAFQLEHIAFPLSGKPDKGAFNIPLTDFKWLREGWKIHKPVADDDDTFEKRYRIFSDELISEIIIAPEYGFYMERRFAKLSDGWNLIYFADMQSPGNWSQENNDSSNN